VNTRFAATTLINNVERLSNNPTFRPIGSVKVDPP